MDNIEKEISYYKANRLDFIELYAGKHLVIKDMQIIGVYRSNTEAYQETVKEHAVGSFIIEHPRVVK